MPRAPQISLLSALAGLALASSLMACAPKRVATVEEIKNFSKMDDVMAAQATYADPQFKKRGQASFTDEEYATLADAAARLQATSLKVKDFSKGPAFDELTMRVNGDAIMLGTAAAAKDAAGVRKALTDMKAACKECHSKFR